MARRAHRITTRTCSVVAGLLLACAFVLGSAGSAHATLTTDRIYVDVDEGPTGVALGHFQVEEFGPAPSDPYVIHFDVPAGVQPIPPITMGPTDWGPRLVDVDLIDDEYALGVRALGQIRLQRKTLAGVALGSWESPMDVYAYDDDFPGLTSDPVYPTVQEGDRVTWTLRLNSMPLAPVTVTLADEPGKTQLVGPSSFTIDPADWNTPHVVEADIVDDDVDDGPSSLRYVSFATASGDSDYVYTNFMFSAVATDDDTAGLVYDPLFGSPLQLTEGSPGGTYRIRLASQPTAQVDVTPSAVGLDVTPSPGLLSFDDTNWNAWQVVTVDAVNDTQPEPSPEADSVTHVFASGDPAYDGLTPPDVPVEVTDDDSPAILVSGPTNPVVAEADATGTEQMVGVRLASAPIGTVRVFAISDGQVVLAGSSVLDFTSSNWMTTQYFRVRAYDDAIAEGATHAAVLAFNVVAANDSTYAAMTPAMRSFQVQDDDLAAAAMECADGPNWQTDPGGRVSLAEDPASTTHSVGCYLRLGTPAGADVVFTISTSASGQVVPDRTSVTIPAGSQGPELVTFTATDDAVDESDPHQVVTTITSTSTDAVYGSFAIAPITMAVSDDDDTGVDVQPAATVSVTEGGGASTARVALTSQPTSTVSMQVTAGTQLQVQQPAGGILTFTPTNWQIAQDVTVMAVDDAIAEPTQSSPVTLTILSSDPTYLALGTATIPVEVVDNEVAAVQVVASGTDTSTREDGATDTFGVRLGSQPSGDVTVTLAADAQLTVTPGTLTFTPANWNVEQSVTATAVQDTVFEGPHAGTVRLEPTSTDPMYSVATAGGSVTVQVADDEEGGVTLTESDASTGVAEAGATDTYTVVLKAQPTADVTIRSDGAPQVATTPAALTFTPANWNVPQAVTVAANQDDLDEADPHTQEIRHAVETSAAGWTGITVATITAKVTDDDSAAIVVVETDGSTAVQEAGAGDMITFRLSSRPAGDVTITGKADAQLSPVKQPIVLTPDAWNKPLELKVTAIADNENEGPHTGTMSFVVASGDPAYGKATVAPITVKITDDDSDVTIMPGTDGGGVTEDDETGSRDPRGTADDDSDKPAGGGGSGDGGSVERRTETGESRTDAGSERTEGGLGLVGTGSGGGDDEDIVEEEPAVLEDEVVSASEPAAKEKPKKPNAVKRAVKKAAKWTKDNQETVATVGGVGLMATGAGTFLLRGDPIKVAQRGLSTALDSRPGKLPGGVDKPHPRLRRNDKPKRGRKKRRNDGDDDAPEGELAGDGAAPDTDS